MSNLATFGFSIGLFLLLGPAEFDASNSKLAFHDKLAQLWDKQKDKYEDFYDFMAREVAPAKDRLFSQVDTRLPNYFVAESAPNGVDFPCKLFHNHTNPASVHRLKPSDIDYVAAMGDSITAAFGAKSSSLLDIFAEFRGVSWSIGGDNSLDQVVTLPNILREYYSNVKGFSIKTTIPKIRNPWRARLNFAVSGAISIDLPGQAKKLINAVKSSGDFHDSWKLLTVWIGGNDLCALCKNDKHTLEKYVGGIRDALDMFHKEVPKMFVNLVQIIDVTELAKISTPYCKVLHKILCKCGTSAGEQVKAEVRNMSYTYRAGVEELINSGRYDTKDDFTVVIQPFFTNTKAPLMPGSQTVDMSYFAPDCFHFSEKGHKAAALALWNNMIEPVGKKRLEWTKGEQFECPTQDSPYFFTKKNSEEFLRRSLTDSDAQMVKPIVLKKPAQSDSSTSRPAESNGVNSVIISAVAAVTVTALIIVAAFVIKMKGRRVKYAEFKSDLRPMT